VTTLKKIAPAGRSVNFYGTTETPQAMSSYVVEDGRTGVVPIGRGIDGVQILVVTEAGGLAAVGEDGEIVVRTPYLALGYMDGRSGGFGVNPFTNDPNDRAYRTGDRGRYLPSGDVEIRGRADDQVKVRGFRVELLEVEDAIRAVPGVRQASAVLREETSSLVGYVVGETPPNKVLEALRAKLPDYMVPSAMVALDTLPLTPNGKVDRRALPAPKRGSIPPPSAEKPANETEAKIAAIWKEVLGLEYVDRNDNFFDVGGHSLNATRIASMVREAFSVELAVRTIFEAPTIAELAARLKNAAAAGSSDGDATPPPITRTDTEAGSVLSYFQEATLEWERRHPPSHTWNTPMRLRLRGPVDEAALKQAVLDVLERQETLRQCIDRKPKSKPRLGAASEVAYVEVDARGKDEAAIAKAIAEHLALFPFDGTPLIRFLVLRLADDDWALHACWHQIVHSGTGHSLLSEEILEAYAARVEKREPRLAPLPFRYVDYAVWERAWFTKGKGQTLVDPARKRIAGAKPLKLPVDHAREGAWTGEAASGRIQVGPEAAERFFKLCAAERATLFMGFSAVVGLAVGKLSGSEDVVLASPINRVDEATKSICGRFGTLIPLRISLAGAKTFGDVIARAKTDATSAFAAASVPESLVFRMAEPYASPFARVVLNTPQLDAVPPGAGPREVAGVTAFLENVDKPYRMRTDVVVRLLRLGAKIVGTAHGEAKLFEKATMEALAARIVNILENARADLPLSDLT
jgi:acyl carrier protein